MELPNWVNRRQIGDGLQMVDTRKIAKEYRLQQWAQMAQEKAESGLTVREYCHRVGIKENTYHHRMKRLRLAAVVAVQNDTLASTPSGWALCATQPKTVSSSGISIEIGKAKVQVTAEADAAQLANIFRMLVGLC
jgi:hypothetical protein